MNDEAFPSLTKITESKTFFIHFAFIRFLVEVSRSNYLSTKLIKLNFYLFMYNIKNYGKDIKK